MDAAEPREGSDRAPDASAAAGLAPAADDATMGGTAVGESAAVSEAVAGDGAAAERARDAGASTGEPGMEVDEGGAAGGERPVKTATDEVDGGGAAEGGGRSNVPAAKEADDGGIQGECGMWLLWCPK